jgi:hypothetical protein
MARCDACFAWVPATGLYARLNTDVLTMDECIHLFCGACAVVDNVVCPCPPDVHAWPAQRVLPSWASCGCLLCDKPVPEEPPPVICTACTDTAVIPALETVAQERARKRPGGVEFSSSLFSVLTALVDERPDCEERWREIRITIPLWTREVSASPSNPAATMEAPLGQGVFGMLAREVLDKLRSTAICAALGSSWVVSLQRLPVPTGSRSYPFLSEAETEEFSSPRNLEALLRRQPGSCFSVASLLSPLDDHTETLAHLCAEPSIVHIQTPTSDVLWSVPQRAGDDGVPPWRKWLARSV